MPPEREADAIGAAEAMAEATARLRRRSWMLTRSIVQPLLPAEALTPADAMSGSGDDA